MTDLNPTSRVIATDLRRAEQSINAAARETAQLLLTMFDGTTTHGISPAWLQPSIKSTVAALTSLVDGQQHLALRAHLQLERAGKGLGLNETAWGEGYPKPTESIVGATLDPQEGRPAAAFA